MNKIPLNRDEIQNIKNMNQINNINPTQKYFSPENNKALYLEVPNDNLNNEIQNERNAFTLGPYLNQIEDIDLHISLARFIH